MDIGPAATDQTTDNTKARQLLQRFCDNGFDGSVSACALVLGRTEGELGEMLHEDAAVDEDLVIKLRGIADERGIDI
jgi:hypothetical protein